MTRVFSFDVFDTCLVRLIGSPAAVFLLLGRRARAAGWIGCAPAEFAERRRDAEFRAYRQARSAHRELRLVDVYRQLQTALELSDATRDELQAAECELEARLCRGVPVAHDWLAEARAGGKVAFLSDMYLSEAFVRERLREQGLLEDGDRVLVSSDRGKNKLAGGLYRTLVEEAGVPAAEILHQGDDEELDGAAARRAGLAVQRRTPCVPNRYERRLESYAAETAGLSSALAGAARWARLEIRAETEAERALRDVAAGVVAPLLVGYVLWVLRQAQGRGVERLYFLARDGQILLELARVLAPRIDVDLELRYLFASRRAWNLPAFASGAHADLAWIWDRTDDFSVETCLARVGVDPSAVGAELEEQGLGASEWSRRLAWNEIERLRSVTKGEAFRRLVHVSAEREQDLLRRHLARERVLAAGAGLVEMVGHANLQESASAIARAAGCPLPNGFYFALMHDARPREIQDPVVYLFDERTGAGIPGFVPGWGVIPLEAFCAADHGTLVGYEERAGGVEPVLAEPRNEPVIGWGLDIMRRTVLACARALVLEGDLVDPEADVRRATAENLSTLWEDPTSAEARVWGAFPWEDGFGRETRYHALARPHPWIHVAKALRRGAIPRAHRAAWGPASLALTPPVRRALLRTAALLGRAGRAPGRTGSSP